MHGYFHPVPVLSITDVICGHKCQWTSLREGEVERYLSRWIVPMVNKVIDKNLSLIVNVKVFLQWWSLYYYSELLLL